MKKFTQYLEELHEGQMKRSMEAKVEQMCDCEGGASLDPSDHEISCPAYKYLKNNDGGSDIDAAEYRMSDR